MKIRCEYCGQMFNDTLEKCPNCGAPNEAVVRKSGNQPLTIEELQKWYRDHGLPSYETTRFFIGINYKQPRAFGIYKKANGDCVVYKNKDNGERAIRYEGSDEAYAVNEIYQRLKQEIIQQKKASIGKQKGSAKRSGSYTGYSSKEMKRKKGLFSGIRSALSKNKLLWIPFITICIALIPFVMLIPIMIIGVIYIVVVDSPTTGYYDFRSNLYYAAEEISQGPEGINDMYWYSYDKSTGSWSDLITNSDEIPDELQKNKSAKNYYLSEEYEDRYGASDFSETIQFSDLQNKYKVRIGYYQYQDSYYYHVEDTGTVGWYYYDDSEEDWYETDYSEVPEELLHDSVAEDFYYTPVWDSSTQITDFKDSSGYQSYRSDNTTDNNDNTGWDWDDDDDDDWDWDTDDDWDTGDTDWDSDW